MTNFRHGLMPQMRFMDPSTTSKMGKLEWDAISLIDEPDREVKTVSWRKAELSVVWTKENVRLPPYLKYNNDVTNNNGRNSGRSAETMSIQNLDEEDDYLHVTPQSPPPPYRP